MRLRFSITAVVVAALFLSFTSCAPTHASLRVEARAETATREVRPSAGAALYLLDEDLIRLAMAAPEANDATQQAVHRRHPRLRVLAGLMNGRRFSAYALGPDIKLLVEQSRPLWEPHVLRAARADEHGRAAFDDLAPGPYWLMCLDDGGGRVAFWNLRLTLARGANDITLDGTNALTVGETGWAR